VKLLTVTLFFPAHGGGLERVAARLVDEFARLGMSISWFSSNTDKAPECANPAMQFVSIPTANFIEKLTQLPYPLWSPTCIPQLWRAIGAADAVHVHEHLYACSIATLLLARLRGKPVILTQHMGALRMRSRLSTLAYETGTRLLGLLLFRIATRTVFISANVRRFFGQASSSRARLIFNGIDARSFAATSPERRRELRAKIGIPEGKSTVLFVGRFVRKKGLHIIAALASRFPDVLWILVGSGPDLPPLEGVNNIRVAGRIEHDRLPDYYHTADLLFLPSSGEGFPLVVQEALACGLGVLSTEEVASACPAVSELIRVRPSPGPGDDIAGWCEGLRAVIADEQYLRSREARSEIAGNLWSWERCASQYMHLFNELGVRQ
jgi:glycosyltransferase involved in cell wall biosynthesis